jgi:hypothetical protein
MDPWCTLFKSHYQKFNDVLDSVTLLVAQVIKLEDPQFRIVHLGYKKLGFSLVFL